jgi:hypothetical protein
MSVGSLRRRARGARIYRTGNQATSGALTAILFNTLEYDSDGFADLANNRLVIRPGMAGRYQVTAGLFWETTAAVAARASVDSATGVLWSAPNAPNAQFEEHRTHTRTIDLVEGDTIEMSIALINNATGLDEPGTIIGNANGTYIEIEFLGRV